MTPQEMEAVRAWHHLGSLMEAQRTAPGGFTALDEAGISRIETAAWAANTAFRNAGLLDASLEQIQELAGELPPRC
jgi:hypothetical protein